MVTSRSLQRGLCTQLLLAALSAAWVYAQDPQFDLLIRNGHVIDPKNNVGGVMDVAITGAKIARIAAGINPASARRVADATGFYVVPGLIDIHAHVFYGTEKDAYLSNSDTAAPRPARDLRVHRQRRIEAAGRPKA